MTDEMKVAAEHLLAAQLAAAQVARLQAELRAASAELPAARAAAAKAQATMVDTYKLRAGDAVEPDGTIVRAANGQGGEVEPPPQPTGEQVQ